MLTKRSLIALLAGVNLLLLAVLLGGSYSLPAAYAYQSRGRPGDFACVTAKAQGRSYDVLWVLDVPERRLHAYYPESPQTKQYVPVVPRNLKADFGRP